MAQPPPVSVNSVTAHATPQTPAPMAPAVPWPQQTPHPETHKELLWDSNENTQRHFDAVFNLQTFRSSWHFMSADTQMGSSHCVVHCTPSSAKRRKGLGWTPHPQREAAPASRALPPPGGLARPSTAPTLFPSVDRRRGLL